MLRELKKLEYTKILVCESNRAFAVQIKEMLKEIVLKPDVHIVSDEKEAYQKMELTSYKIFLFNCTTLQDELDAIMKYIEKNLVKVRPIVIGFIPDTERESGKLSDILSAGIPNVMYSPFSMGDLTKIVVNHNLLLSHVEKIKKAKLIVKTLIASATKNIDKLSENLALGQRTNLSAKKNMKSLKARIEAQLDILDEEDFFYLLEKYLEEVKPVQYRGHKKPRKHVKKEIVRHPGYELNEIMRTRNLSAEKLAQACKVEVRIIESLCKEEINLNDELANKIATHIGQTQEYWISLQNKFDKLGKKRTL